MIIEPFEVDSAIALDRPHETTRVAETARRVVAMLLGTAWDRPSYYAPRFCTFAHVSLSETLRLKTGLPG